MDAGPLPAVRPPTRRWRPDRCDKVGLVLQGGGALGAYQAGVYQALHEAGLEPDWVAGVSIGSINGAIIAGNPPALRLERLREFWDLVTSRPVFPFLARPPEGDLPRKLFNAWSSFLTALLGQPGFFRPAFPGPWFTERGEPGATSFYDTAPLHELLLKLVDFDVLNSGDMRYSAGAVNVENGNFSYFDSAEQTVTVDHTMASGALPPALPMVKIGTHRFWDGALVSNTPLQYLLEKIGADNLLVFQVDLFSAIGPRPCDMFDVMSRQKDIQYSSRTRLVTDLYLRMHRQNVQMRKLLDKLPDDRLDEAERTLKQRLSDLPQIALLHLIYRESAYEGEARDYDFSASSMREHWDLGYRDTVRTLRHRDWLEMPGEDEGIVVHDVHRSKN